MSRVERMYSRTRVKLLLITQATVALSRIVGVVPAYVRPRMYLPQ